MCKTAENSRGTSQVPASALARAVKDHAGHATAKGDANLGRCLKPRTEERCAFKSAFQDRDKDQAALTAHVHDYNHVPSGPWLPDLKVSTPEAT